MSLVRIGFAIISFIFLADVNAQSTNCTTSKCHQSVTQNRFLHRPLKTKDCLICHQIDSTNESHRGRKGAHPSVRPFTMEKITELCLSCHEGLKKAFAQKSSWTIHSAIEERSCIACHSPHGSEHRYLVRKDSIKNLCLSCHDILKGERSSLHSPVSEERGCLNCHTVHYSQHKNLLKEQEKDLCLTCHAQPIKGVSPIGLALKKSYLHGPILKGRCTSCHVPHKSTFAHLLKENYSMNNYLNGEHPISEVAHCFTCHDRTLIDRERVTTQTQFRNGSKNLHYLHFQGAQRGCHLCHDSHASNNHSLIRPSFEYLTKMVPILFERSPTGGKCATMCHKTLTYDREQEMINVLDR